MTWAQHQRARGEDVDQTSQKPMAFSLGSGGDAPGVVRLRNETAASMEYEYRWAGGSSWQNGRVASHGLAQHAPPDGGDGRLLLEVRFKEGKPPQQLHVGKTYTFHDKR